ncbi:MAG: fumarylacetoacetate hydrolase family protein, partial [Ectothiorhodospiraceae bacterium]
QNVMCLGLNYAAHAEESLRTKGSDLALPEHPVVFTKAVTSVTGPHSDVVLDPQVTTQADWEVELAVVIGRRARHVSRYDALSCVLGYTVVNDLSARDLQFRHKQFFVGKSVEGFCPMGPWIVTADEIDDPQNLDLWCRVNGVEKQAGNTQDQIFGIADTISRLSRSMTLEPGDIIATGTPDGVGFARQPPEFLAPGDVVECEVQGVGVIRNRMIAP